VIVIGVILLKKSIMMGDIPILPILQLHTARVFRVVLVAI
jgi:hypothetical protein